MAQVINTNILSLNAQRNLTTSSGALQTSLQRLSSGLRINSAKDDAAGLAISERFSTQIRGINQAVRNANDGISLAQVAEGALGEVSNNLQRIRELAVQARNATNSDADRAALDAEVQQRINEIERVAGQTEFNGTKLLDGSFSSQVFQIGANKGETISVDSIANAKTAELGDWNSSYSGTLSVGTGDVTFDDSGTPNVGSWTEKSFTVTVDGVETTITVAEGTSESAPADVAAVQADLAAATATAINAAFGAGSAEADGAAVTITLGGDFTLANADSGEEFTADLEAIEAAGDGLTGFAGEDVTTAERADRMMLAMDAALTAVNGARAELGAVQNRFESVVANLSSASENLSASRSRILDADFAAETAQLTRAQILQQAGISVLSQANAAPQSVLNLLR